MVIIAVYSACDSWALLLKSIIRHVHIGSFHDVLFAFLPDEVSKMRHISLCIMSPFRIPRCLNLPVLMLYYGVSFDMLCIHLVFFIYAVFVFDDHACGSRNRRIKPLIDSIVFLEHVYVSFVESWLGWGWCSAKSIPLWTYSCSSLTLRACYNMLCVNMCEGFWWRWFIVSFSSRADIEHAIKTVRPLCHACVSNHFI